MAPGHLRHSLLLLATLIVLSVVFAAGVGCVRSDLAEAFGHVEEGKKPNEPEPVVVQPNSTVSSQPPKPAPAKAPAGSLQVTASRIVTEAGVRYVTGTIKNGTRQLYVSVEVQISFYDKSGGLLNTVQKASAELGQGLKPGASWNFRAAILDNRAVTYKITNVKGTT